MNETLPAIIVEPAGSVEASVIWMHGLGADGHDFEPLVPQLQLPASPGIRFIFPHAPTRPVTVNGNMLMRAWFDIRSADISQRQDEAGLRASEKLIRTLIDTERGAGVPARNILLAGFSQGGAMALQVALRYPERLAGALVLSGLLPLQGTLPEEAADANVDLPIFMAHGLSDPVIPVELARSGRDRLVSLGYPVIWREYSMPHSLCGDEVRDLRNWMLGVLPVSNPETPVSD